MGNKFVRGLLLFTLFTCFLVPPSQVWAGESDIIINEIMYNPCNDDNWGGEYLELYNKGATSVDLSDWVIGGIGDYSIPNGTTLAAGEYLVVYRDPNAPIFYGLTNCVGPYEPSNLSNGGESIILKNSSLVTIDIVAYDDD